MHPRDRVLFFPCRTTTSTNLCPFRFVKKSFATMILFKNQNPHMALCVNQDGINKKGILSVFMWHGVLMMPADTEVPLIGDGGKPRGDLVGGAFFVLCSNTTVFARQMFTWRLARTSEAGARALSGDGAERLETFERESAFGWHSV